MFRLGRHAAELTAARVAIIVDDLGGDLQIAGALAALDAPVTFAVLPFELLSRQVADLAHQSGREVILHLPMESDRSRGLGIVRMLTTSDGRAEVESLLEEATQAVPHAVGVNNHMGSRVTRDRERMGWILAWLKTRGLFFVDSRTTNESVAVEAAIAVGLPVARRDVFLDHDRAESAVRRQLTRLLTVAQQQGTAIAIAHPHDATVRLLRAVLPEWRGAGVQLVPVSALVHSPASAAGLITESTA